MNAPMAHGERHSTAALLDEEALAERVAAPTRRARGVYFSPAEAVEAVLERVAPFVPRAGSLAIVDPACGGGAFLAAAQRRWPRATLFGLELLDENAEDCARRLPRARIEVGDALAGGALERLLARVPRGAFELWVGNPPYNGTSTLLIDPEAYARLRAMLVEHQPLLRGTSIRDDFAFFLLRAAERLTRRKGALAFITSATLLDAYAHAPLRKLLCAQLALRDVYAFPPGTFRGTKVRTCATVWTAPGPTVAPVRFGASTFVPRGESFAFRPEDEAAAALDARWRAHGEELTTLIPVSFPGLKTRFDELLVDADRDRLLRRMKDFLRLSPEQLLKEWWLPGRVLPKLRLLRAAAPRSLEIERSKVRRFLPYKGPKGFQTGIAVPAWCYLERALIPRGDHRLRGQYDPHQGKVKLAFNVRELPLHAALVEEEGCVTAYRHSRFAPLWVPQCALTGGASAAAKNPRDKKALNFSPRGAQWVKRVGDPVEALRRIVDFVRSDEVQKVWAPAFGTTRVLPVPFLEW
jgi:tRNA1(Val) A37 N6-methylase TrmN6